MACNKLSVYDFVLEESFKKWVDDPHSEEGIMWEKWIEKNPGHREIIQEARQLILFMDFGTQHLPQKEVHDLWQKLEQRIDKKNPESIHKINQQPKPNRNFLIKLSGWAAGFVGFLLINLCIYFMLDRLNTETYVTDYGEQKTFLLPDGSTAILNANSALKYRTGIFNSGLREVWLNGEAYFSVVPSPDNQRFLVHAEGLGVEVLGTEFNVKQRGKGFTKVVLSSGKIKLRLPGHFETGNSEIIREVIMRPGELAEYSNVDKTLKKNIVDTDKYIAWSENKLVFDDTPLAEIVGLLEENYGYHVILQKEEWGAKTFTATYPADDIEILLHALSKSFNLSIHQKGKTLHLVQNDPES